MTVNRIKLARETATQEAKRAKEYFKEQFNKMLKEKKN